MTFSSRIHSGRLALLPIVISACAYEVPQQDVPDSEAARISQTALSLGMPEDEVARIDRYVRDLVPEWAVVDYRELNGEPVDCVDIYEQPAARALRARGIELGQLPVAPRSAMAGRSEVEAVEGETLVGPYLKEPCPEGSVPIRRLTIEEIASYGSLNNYLYKEPPAIKTHEYATVQADGTNYGLESVINIWYPAGGGTNDFSLSQIWAGGGVDEDVETVEAGWIKRTADSYSRIFIFFTPDAYAMGGGSCWNTDCGFIQTDTSVVLNGQIGPASVSGGNQYAGHFLLFKDFGNGSWWFQYGTSWIGYWPRELFDETGIKSTASLMTWGGEVYDYAGALHTTFDMGDSTFPTSTAVAWQHSSYQRNLRYWTSATAWDEADPSTTIVSNSSCYNLLKSYNSSWKNHIYFGGKGYHATNCPY